MDSNEDLFSKIKFLNTMADQIIAYGEQCGASGLRDYVDMNCGGIPDGEYARIVDQDAPEQFLAMYRKVAENRFSLTVSTLKKANEGFMKPIAEYCERDGAGCADWWNPILKEIENEQHSD